VQLGLQLKLVERRAHVPQPRVALGLADGEVRVPHPQPRVATALVIGRRAAPVLDQEQPQVLLRPPQITAPVHPPPPGVGRDLLVEPVDQAAERRLAPDGLVQAQCLRLAHNAPGYVEPPTAQPLACSPLPDPSPDSSSDPSPVVLSVGSGSAVGDSAAAT